MGEPRGASAIDKVDRSGFGDCGTNTAMLDDDPALVLAEITVEDRIAQCASENGADATWDGAVKSNTGHGVWKLVTRSGANNEVWRDERTGLLWSARIQNADLISGSTTWCQAAGNNEATDGICNNATHQPNTTNPRSICAEGEEGGLERSEALAGGEDWTAGVYHAKKGEMGLHPNASNVEWYLPTREDYFQAYANGMGYVLPQFLGSAHWTSSVYSADSNYAWYFYANSGGYVEVSVNDRDYVGYYVRCVGR